jgi:hypothetical protein
VNVHTYLCCLENTLHNFRNLFHLQIIKLFIPIQVRKWRVSKFLKSVSDTQLFTLPFSKCFMCPLPAPQIKIVLI